MREERRKEKDVLPIVVEIQHRCASEACGDDRIRLAVRSKKMSIGEACRRDRVNGQESMRHACRYTSSKVTTKCKIFATIDRKLHVTVISK